MEVVGQIVFNWKIFSKTKKAPPRYCKGAFRTKFGLFYIIFL